MNKPTKLPEIGDYVHHNGTLVAIEDVTPKEVVLDYIFEETEAKLIGRINGKVVKEYGTFNNFYGKDTCVEMATRRAQEEQRRLGESNLEFVVIKRTYRVRKRPDPHERENFYAKGFREMRALECNSRWNLPDDIEEVVWSSKKDGTS